MKLRLVNIRSLALWIGALAAAPAFGQTTYTWTGGGDGTNLAVAANWGGTLPDAGLGDTAMWNGTTAGNLSLTYNTGNWQSGPGSSGITYYLASGQSGSVQVDTTLSVSSFLSFNNVTVEAGTGGFTLGGTNPAVRLDMAARPAGAVHSFVNESTAPSRINQRVRWVAGGGASYTMAFSGSGNWFIDNYLVSDNTPANAVSVQVDGPGNMIWTPSGHLGVNTLGTITINGGQLILKRAHPRLNSQAMTLGGAFVFDAPSETQVYSGIISDPSANGFLIVSNGTLSLSGQSTHAGTNLLAGGTLVVNGTENVGVSGPLGFGPIAFAGGTLQFSANNTFDYSSRFDTANGQKYAIHSGGQSVTLATGLGGTGSSLTKLGSGNLILTGSSSYSGATVVSAGKLVFEGAKSGTGSLVVSNGAAVGVTVAGSPMTPSSLVLGSGSGVTIEFNNISSTSVAPLAAGAISGGGTVTVNINSGAFAAGASYPLVTWSSGTAPTFALGALNGAVGNLSVAGNTLFLNVTALAHVWVGSVDGNWDTTTANWKFNGVVGTYTNGQPALFDDSAPGSAAVSLTEPVSPSSLTVYSSSKAYSLASSGANAIGGSGTLTKGGNAILTLSGGVNSYSGPTTISGGILSVGNLASGGAASDIGSSGSAAQNLVLAGGSLQYTGTGVASDRLFTLSTANGGIESSGSGALVLNNTGDVSLSGSGTRTLTLSGSDTNDNTLAASLGDNGGASGLTKNGTGKWVLTGNNSYSGLTTIANGVLQVGAGGPSGTLGTGSIVDNGSLIFNTTSTTTNGAVSGSGSVTVRGSGKVILAGDNTYTGGTTIETNRTLQLGNGGATGSLIPNNLVNHGTLIFDTTGTVTFTGFGQGITGSGNVIARGGGWIRAVSDNTYSGWTLIEPGTIFQPSDGNGGTLNSSIVTNNGVLFFTRQEADPAVFGYSNNIVGTGSLIKENNNPNAGWIVLAGTNTYTGGTTIRGGGIVLGDGVRPGAGSVLGDIVFTNTSTPYLNQRLLVFNRADDFTFTNNIVSSVTDGSDPVNQGAVRQMGPGTVTLSGNNSYPGFTTIDVTMTLIAGTGGTGGAIGTGNLTVEGTFIYNRSADHTINGVVSGSGTFVKAGAGTLNLMGTDTFFGTTSVSNGTLNVNGNSTGGGLFNINGGTLGGLGTIAGPVTLDPGTTLAPGTATTPVGALTFNNFVDIQGNVAVHVNKGVTNDFLVVNGGAQKTGTGTLTITSVGAALAAGDKFTLFSLPVNNGSAFTITGSGATWQNDLEVDGSVTVLTAPTVNQNPPVVQVSLSANTLSLGWPTNRGWILQTNAVALTATNQWFPYAGSENLTNVNLTIDRTKTNVFFRMIRP